MIDAVLHGRRDPARALCVFLVLALAIYFGLDVALLYAKLDFGARGLGSSPVSDFFAFYSSARFLHGGGDLAALYDPAALKAFQVSLGASADGLHPFTYPPTYALLIEPLGALPYATALLLWQWGTFAAFACSLRLAGLSGMEATCAAAAPASIMNFAAGQNGFLTSALLIAGMACLARRPAAAGSLFGLLTVKPHLGVLVPLACLAERHWRAIGTAALVAAGLIAVSLMATGTEPWRAYFDFLTWFLGVAASQSDGPFLALTSTPYMAARILGLPGSFAFLVQAAVTVFVAAAVFSAFRRKTQPAARLALLLVGASLATPYGNLYDLPFIGVAVVLLARRGLHSGFLPYEGLVLLTAFLVPFIGGPLNEAGVPLVPAVHLVLFLYIQARLRRGGVEPDA